MEYKIDPRDGIEVFVNGNGNISLKQNSLACGETIIALHPDEVLELIGILQKIHQDAIAFREEEESSSES